MAHPSQHGAQLYHHIAGSNIRGEFLNADVIVRRQYDIVVDAVGMNETTSTMVERLGILNKPGATFTVCD